MTMAPLWARRLDEMVGLAERITAIDPEVAAQAVDLRAPPALGEGDGRPSQADTERRALHGGRPTRRRIDLVPVLTLIRSGPAAACGADLDGLKGPRARVPRGPTSRPRFS